MSLTAGSANNGNSNSTKTFVTALVANGGLLLAEVAAFVILKARLGRIYSPRTFLPPPGKRSEELPRSWWKWLPAVLLSPTKDIIHKNGLDAYMFLRFLRMLILIFTVYTVAGFLIVVPLNAAGIESGHLDLDRITWSNIVEPEDQKRFGGHVAVVYLLTFFVFYMIRREMLHFIDMRHQFLISKSHSRSAQARTVLITTVPDELATEQDLRQFASFVPGGVDKVWIYRDTKALNELFNQRQEACAKLEAAQAEVLKLASKQWRIKEKAHEKERKRSAKRGDVEGAVAELVQPPPSREVLNELVPDNKRPKHRTGFLGLVGEKVDTIYWCRNEIVRLNALIKEARENLSKGKFLGSAFIRCHSQMGAHVLAQCVSYHKPLAMYGKWLETSRADIVWDNLDDGALEMRSRYVISWALTIGLIIVWGFPVAFIGTLSNLDDLCNDVRWLAWVCTAPTPVPGIIQGIIPPLLLAILFAILPFILRALAWYECIPRYSLISISVYKRFFLFLLVHGFLIVTLSSGITKTIQDIIRNPTETVQNLASQLPGASIFFLTYMVTQGLSGAGAALAQLFPLAMHFIHKWYLGRTPRQAYEVTFLMPSADFGIMLPRLSLLATIAFAYSVLSPLINLLALICFAMFYLAWKFLFSQVFDQPDSSETGGLYFPMAVSNLFVGLYIEQICLACLFFLRISTAKVAAIVEGVLMLCLLVITFGMQQFIHNSFDPITHYLPMSLATKKMAKRYEREQKKKEGLLDDTSEQSVDIFSRQHVKRVRKRIRMIDNKLDSLKAKVRAELEDKKKRRKDKKEKSSIEKESVEVVTTAVDTTGDMELSRQHSAGSSKKSVKKAEAEHMEVTSRPHSPAGSEDSVRTKETAPPEFDAPAPAGVDLSDDGSDDDEDEEDDHAFDHPSTYVEQPWIWIPQDRLGLSEIFVEELTSVGVDASSQGAQMDGKGVVEVTRNPPDEEWTGGHDR